MVKKFTLTGTDNDGFRHRYSVKKIEEFKEAFVKFMVDLGFNEEAIQKSFLTYQEDDGGYSQSRALKISEIEDVCWNYKNSKYDVDIFFGRFKIIFVIRTKKRVPMIEHLERKANWIKPFGIKKIVEERDKKGKIFIPLRKAPNVS